MPEPQPRIISRAEWGARPPKGTPIVVPWSKRTGSAIHHSAGPQSQSVRDIQNFHMDTNNWSDIGYNMLVGEPGVMYVGRGFEIQGTHSGGENVSHVAVCYIGNTDIVTPSPAALSAIRWFYEECCRRAGRTLSYSGHGSLPGEATACPGNWLENWLAQGMIIGGSMELSTPLDNVTPTRTVNDALAGALQMRNAEVSPPDASGQGFPPAGSRGELKVRAAQIIIDVLGAGGDDLAQGIADALAGNEAWTQSLADRIAEQVTQQPITIELTGTGTPTPAP